MAKIHLFNVTKIILVCLIILSSVCLDAQTRAVRKAIRNKENTEKREEKKYEQSRERAIDEHIKRQSDQTKEQMKISKKKADKFNNENKRNFIEAFIGKQKIKKEKRKRGQKTKRR